MFDKINSVDICLITYKREQALTRCLDSLLNLIIPPWVSVYLYVVDNDVNMSALSVVNDFKKVLPFDVRYFVSDVNNISKARNLSVSKGISEVLLFIDDDEMAREDWLVKHLFF